ncbi:16087_t:CDS:2 [Acaulospora morrowiae]|uniref:16087_t:CDS:1 n=1 Tax=Acaulospora morrowiae TaxID=94023 RepID=A0A9N9G1R9_9GLOM|nr:16087_t:CDS:2 [Acaulospora morrowiae]
MDYTFANGVPTDSQVLAVYNGLSRVQRARYDNAVNDRERTTILYVVAKEKKKPVAAAQSERQNMSGTPQYRLNSGYSPDAAIYPGRQHKCRKISWMPPEKEVAAVSPECQYKCRMLSQYTIAAALPGHRHNTKLPPQEPDAAEIYDCCSIDGTPTQRSCYLKCQMPPRYKIAATSTERRHSTKLSLHVPSAAVTRGYRRTDGTLLYAPDAAAT